MAILDNITAAWSLDESSGNALDSSGNGNTLTNTGSVGYVTGLINNGAQGTATTGGYLIAASDFGLATSSTNTWNIWYKRGSTATGYIIDNISAVASSIRFILYESAGTLRMFANGNEVATGTLTVGTWYMITVTKNNTTWELFVNTVSQGTASTGGLTYGGGSGFTVLNSLYTGGTTTNATVDIGTLWTRVITSGEMSQLYNGGAGIQYPFSVSVPDLRLAFL